MFYRHARSIAVLVRSSHSAGFVRDDRKVQGIRRKAHGRAQGLGGRGRGQERTFYLHARSITRLFYRFASAKLVRDVRKVQGVRCKAQGVRKTPKPYALHPTPSTNPTNRTN
jgi:hypothetical protein